ncbi:IS110 family transposase [Tundrisphaera lichenicola]|uniref:IS110 family transposase n=1 Tax=Tundrisphaera lichenicola TaxID=2029860 RepID=UPI003EBC93B6
MDVLHDCCAGLDVHKKTVVACVRRVHPAGKVSKTIKTFATMTGDLLALGDWLGAQGVATIAMESTGSYWKPVFNILESRFTVILVNAHHIKQVPGRKTDVKDSEWIAQLLQPGLLRPSFIPPQSTRQLRDLTRQRTQLVGQKTAVANRIAKVLEDANIKLGSVASEVLGVSGRAMIEAIIRGEYDPVKLADLARRRLRGKIPQLQLALRGSVTEHHRFLLRTQMDHLLHLEAIIRRYEERIEETLPPAGELVARLMTIPGVDVRVAQVILAEIGQDMDQFPSAGHLSSWAGLASGNHESAGKRQSGRTTPGNRWLKTALVQAAWAASRARKTHLARKFSRIARSRGQKRAAIAVAHTLLVIIYHLLKEKTTYREIVDQNEAA